MKTHPRLSVWFLLLGLAASASAAQAPSLTLHEAIDRALGKNPLAAMARADQEAASATARQARTQLLPQLNFVEEISRGNDPVYAFGTRLRQQKFTQADFALNALNRPQPIGNFATRFAGSWQVFDSFKTQKDIRRADLYKQSAAASAQAADQQIVLRVVQAYQSVLFAQRQIEVARHEQQTAEALLKQVADRVHAGLAVESDRMAAEVNVAARRQELIAARGEQQLAWADLREAMGAPEMQPVDLAPIESKNYPQASLESELALAATMRPDVAALHGAQSAQATAVGSARSGMGPRVSAYGNWEQDRGTLAGSGGNNWVAGVQLSLDILPFARRQQLARENAAKRHIDAEMEQAQQQVRLQVSRAHIQRETAGLQVETARAALDLSQENLRILKNRYNAGLATITDLLRSEDAGRQSQSNYWRAVYGYAMAYAQLLYAKGTLTPDAAEELQ